MTAGPARAHPGRAGRFTLVMATGIVSIALYLIGQVALAWALLAIGAGAYVVLALTLLERVDRQRAQVAAELADPDVGPDFLAVVAATAVLGGQGVIVARLPGVGLVLLALAALLWLLIFYGWAAGLVLRASGPALAESVDGGWLLPVVATQSLSVLATLTAAARPGQWPGLLVVALALFLFGLALYVPVILLVGYRLAFLRLEPADCAPSYWITMGAPAISTLAGALLVEQAAAWPGLEAAVPFLLGLTLAAWAVGSAWIPLLVVLGVWRHVRRRHPLRYEWAYWAMVFPLGMYAVSSLQLSYAADLAFLRVVAGVFTWTALAAWAIVFAGLVRRMLSRRRRDAADPARP